MGVRIISEENLIKTWPCGLPPPTLGILPNESEPKLLTRIIEFLENSNGRECENKNEKQGEENYAR